MTKNELREALGRLELFLESLLPLMGRLERRRWGNFYVQGLLLDGGRKSAAHMAQRYGGDVQALQQFISQSPWEWDPIRKRLALKAGAALGSGTAWILDDTGFPKKGEYSVGVARQYTGTLGKVCNCQIGVSLSCASYDGCFPLDFELYLPEEWIYVPERRAKAGIPEDVKFRTKPNIGLDLIDRSLSWGVPAGVVCADAAYGDSSDFRKELSARNLEYAVGVKGATTIWTDASQTESVSVKSLIASLSGSGWTEVCWREGTKGDLKGRFAAMRVTPAHDRKKGLDPLWLLAEELPDGGHKYWFSNLPDSAQLLDLVKYAKIRWWIEQNYQQLKDELGLDHFEGRTWAGWHHHVTLTMLAFSFLMLERLHSKKNFWVWFDPAPSQGGDSDGPIVPIGLLSNVRDKDSRFYLT